MRCGFYLSEFSHLDDPDRIMEYDFAFIQSAGGPCTTLLELQGVNDISLARLMFLTNHRLGAWIRRRGMTLSREIHMTDDAEKFLPVATVKQRASIRLLLHEGKTIHQFTDCWETAPRFCIDLDRLSGKPQTLQSTQYYRAACREISRSTDERTAIATMLPPGILCGHTISVERRPSGRPNSAALSLVGLMNSFAFDWLLRQKAAAHVSLYILMDLPAPQLTDQACHFLAHATLRLCCNHAGYAPLWQEQLGSAWREPQAPWTWPTIPDESDRWHLRAAMDAVVAQAYGLNRTQYEQILQSFSHKSFPAAPSQCLAAFDALADSGLAAFATRHDPYQDIPLVTTPAQPAQIGVSPSSGVSNVKHARGKRCSTTPRLSTTS